MGSMNPVFLDRAVDLSRRGMRAGEGGPFGAVIVRGEDIVAEGVNRVIATRDPTNHAEIIAIREAARVLDSFDLSGCELYASAEPCPMCLGAIYWARLDAVYFANSRADAAEIGFDDAMIYEELDKDADQRRTPFKHHPDARAQAVFAEWLATEDKTQY